MSNHGRIRRGPVAANVLGQQFTQVWNRAVRDKRLSRRARGLLVELLSHRDGFGISIPSLVAAGPEGRDAIRVALAELERYGYLHRVQGRDDRGRLGETVYEITDMPEGMVLEAPAPWAEEEPSAPPQRQNRRSEPTTDLPTTGGPTTVNPPHKKTTSKSKKISGEKTISLPHVPEPRADPAPAADERETSASPSKPTLTTAQRAIRAAGVLAEGEDETAFLDWVTAVHEPRSNAWWRTVAANGDLPDLAADWRTEAAPAPAQPAARALPPWCGECQGEPVAMRYRDRDDGRSYRCPACHPDTAPTWASTSPRQDTASHNAGVLARYRARTSSGHQPFQCPTDQSVYDLGFDGRPLPGTDTTVAGWGAVARQLDDDQAS